MGLFSIFKKNKEKKQEAKKYEVGLEKTRKGAFSRLTALFRSNNSITDDYTVQIVDNQNPWKANLEPRVVEEDGKFVLGWFEPKPNKELEKVEKQIIDISNLVGQKGSSNSPSTGIFADLDLKANKNEIETLIQESISQAEHLKRVIVNSIEDIDKNAPDAQQYIYLIASGLKNEDNKYYEYLVIENQAVQLPIFSIDFCPA